jgi:hypothetical protein
MNGNAWDVWRPPSDCGGIHYYYSVIIMNATISPRTRLQTLMKSVRRRQSTRRNHCDVLLVPRGYLKNHIVARFFRTTGWTELISIAL